MKMTHETSNELARIADYLDLVLLDGIPFRLLNQCIRFFIELFTATNIRANNIVSNDDLFFQRLRSHAMQEEVFQEWSARAYETKFYSNFGCMQLQVVPPLRELHDIFPVRFARNP